MRVLCSALLLGAVLAMPPSQAAAQSQPQTPGSQTFISAPFPNLQCCFFYPGDFNQDGEVNASDLTPLGQHFGRRGSFSPESVEFLVDADRNGEINQADMVAIAKNLGPVPAASYEVWCEVSSVDTRLLATGPVDFSRPVAPGKLRLLEYTVPDSAQLRFDHHYYFSFLDSNGVPPSGPTIDSKPVFLPSPPVTRPDMLLPEEEILSNPSRTQFSWRYFSQADSDQNGRVDWLDIVGIARNWRAVCPDLNWHPLWMGSLSTVSLSDWDLNGEVNGADLARMRFLGGRTVSGYRLYIRPTAAEYPAEPWEQPTIPPYRSIPFSSAQGDPAGPERLRFECEVPGDFTGYSWWVRPYAPGGWEGAPSELRQL